MNLDRSLWCWGWNDSGHLGDGTNIDGRIPVRIMAGQVSLEFDQVCAIKTDGSLWCWGKNSVGQLGDETTFRILRCGTWAMQVWGLDTLV